MSLASRDERGRRPEDFEFTPAKRTQAPQNTTDEYSAKEEDKIRELVVLFGYSYEQARRKIKRARLIKRSLMAVGIFATVLVIADEALSETPQNPIVNFNSLLPSLLDQTTSTPIRLASADDLFEVRRNMPQKPMSCKKIITQKHIEHTVLSPN